MEVHSGTLLRQSYLLSILRSNSPLIHAALNGYIAVLDGIESLQPTILATIERLVLER